MFSTSEQSATPRGGSHVAIDLQSLILALISALLSGGGVATWLRASGQNRNEYLTKVLDRLAHVEARTDEQDKQLAEGQRQNAELGRELGREQGQRAALEKSLDELRGLARDLTGQVGQLAQRVAEETTERARAVHHEQVQRSRADFLERENNTLRAEISRIQLLLPARTPPEPRSGIGLVR